MFLCIKADKFFRKAPHNFWQEIIETDEIFKENNGKIIKLFIFKTRGEGS